MKVRAMNYKRAFGGGKKLPPLGRMRTMKGVRRGVRIGRHIVRNF